MLPILDPKRFGYKPKRFGCVIQQAFSEKKTRGFVSQLKVRDRARATCRWGNEVWQSARMAREYRHSRTCWRHSKSDWRSCG